MKQFDRVLATFAPKRTEDLTPAAVAAIGRRGIWIASWIIDDGQFAGQWAMDWRDADPWFGWCPSGDLADVEPVADE